jgi:3-oxoacyl-[acyl-carrier protein] reductase
MQSTRDDIVVRRALVVGASSRIGHAVAIELNAGGLEVTATHHRSGPKEGPAVANWHALDVTDETSIRNFVREVEDSGLVFDVVVIVVGLLPGKPLDQYDLNSIDAVMRANFSGPACLISKLSPHLRAGSCVVMFSSVSGERGSYDPIYAASKGAIVSLVKSLATWLAPRTRFVAVAPALVEDSGMYEDMRPERRAFHRDSAPLGRLITPEEVARIVSDLTQDHWAHANGTCVRINGGTYV